MKSNLRFIFLFALSILFTGSLFAQTLPWDQVVLEENGDTIVVKPTSMGGGLNSMFVAIMGDTTDAGERNNPNRVYKTVRGETYVYDGPAYIDATVPLLKIVAEPGTDLPPLHIKTTDPEGGLNKAFYGLAGSFYMENQYILQALTNNTLDRNFFRYIGDNGSYTFKNIVFEFTNWAFMSNFVVGSKWYVQDCLVHNLGREANLEKGNGIDSQTPLDTMWIENTTFLNHGNMVLVRPNAAPSFGYFNHNTIVNATQSPFLFFSQAEEVVTNNNIVNAGILPDYPGFYPFMEDEDKLPKGIINVDTVETAWIEDHWLGEYPVASEGDRKILVDNNNVWWDPRFDDMLANQMMEIPSEIGDYEWRSQMILMNDRTQAFFDDDNGYPYLVEGDWYNIEPDFVNNADIVDDWVSFIVTNAKPGEPNGGDPQPIWRTNMETDLTTPDWPVLEDLAYTDATLMTGATNNYPVGDLNWFPDLKEQWEETDEATHLIDAMKAGAIPDDWAAIGINDNKANSFNANVQVYPNPFDNSTTLKFNLVRSSDVDLIVYNILGERVKVLELGHYAKGVNEVTFNKGDLQSGMYLIQLNTNYNNAGLISKISIK